MWPFSLLPRGWARESRARGALSSHAETRPSSSRRMTRNSLSFLTTLFLQMCLPPRVSPSWPCVPRLALLSSVVSVVMGTVAKPQNQPPPVTVGLGLRDVPCSGISHHLSVAGAQVGTEVAHRCAGETASPATLRCWLSALCTISLASFTLAGAPLGPAPALPDKSSEKMVPHEGTASQRL